LFCSFCFAAVDANSVAVSAQRLHQHAVAVPEKSIKNILLFLLNVHGPGMVTEALISGAEKRGKKPYANLGPLVKTTYKDAIVTANWLKQCMVKVSMQRAKSQVYAIKGRKNLQVQQSSELLGWHQLKWFAPRNIIIMLIVYF
jgi:hypothetical protein